MIIIILIFLLLGVYTFVKADYTCAFKGDVNKGQSWGNSLIGTDGYFKIKITSDNIEALDGDVTTIIDPYIDSNWTLSKIVSTLGGKCPASVGVCRLKGIDSHGTKIGALMNDTLEAKFIEKERNTF